jgi:hypothetical protein
LLLGTEIAAAAYARYDITAGAHALRQYAAEGHLQSAPTPHLKTLAFPTSELLLMQLHRALVHKYPEVPCARWERWELDTPASPKLDDAEGCSMALRFLQHCIDAHE